MTRIICIIAVLIVFVVLVFWILEHLRTKRLMAALDEMLENAIRGSFSTDDYDESQLSRLESKMEHFLDATALTENHVALEHQRMKTLISDISHQTKTPIANLILYSELLEDDQLTAEQRQSVDAIRGQAEKLRFLIDSLIKLSRLENGILVLTPKQNPLEPMLQEIYQSFIKKAEKKGLQFIVKSTDATAYMDEKWTTEALSNIVDNAIKYTKTGSVIISVQPYEMFVRIDVKDTGIGIPEAEQAQVFGRFYRSAKTKNEQGVGIGLFLSREIVSQEGGYIKLSSSEKGTTFSVFLPQNRILQN